MIRATEDQLSLYRSLFRGREDVYARRWEKNGRSGYAPAYQFDWDEFNAHRRTGGTMATFSRKTLLPFTPDVIKKHLMGQYVVGIYPLLADNTSYFIAADFDGEGAFEDAKRLVASCADIGLPAYLERSRSGNGAHVWLFFDDAYPVARSRKIILECVRRALHLSEFDKEVSFDRLFPNQDVQSGKGFGNLIALPIQGISAARGNSIFLDPEMLTPYPDQFSFLASMKRIPITVLEKAYDQLADDRLDKTASPSNMRSGKAISLRLDVGIRIVKNRLDKETVNFIREELNFPNLNYWLKKRLGKSVYQTEKFFRLIEEEGEDVILPRGFFYKLTDHFRSRGIPFMIYDKRTSLPNTSYSSVIRLQPKQLEAVEAAMETDQGVIVAPPGSGKTIMGLELMARRKQPALILAHRKQILDQWVDRIQTFLCISKTHIGRIDGSKKKIGEKVTVAMMQSLARMEDLSEFTNAFGLILVDECHHIPAKTFREVISHFNSRYCYGLTATPKRKHNDEKLIYLFIGDLLIEIEEPIEIQTPPKGGRIRKAEAAKKSERRVSIRETDLEVPFSFTADNYQVLARIVSFDQSRNRLILDDIKRSIGEETAGKTLILSERKEHLEALNLYLKGMCETILITGDDSAASRKSKFAQLAADNYRVILATGQLLGEGMDLPSIKTVILAFPLAFEGKLAQYIGRIRGEKKIVYDYCDIKTPFLERQYKKRLKFYKKNGFNILKE